LFSVAFHPDYETNRRFFVSYTAPGGGPAGHSVVAQYKVRADDPDRADPDSAVVLLTVDQPFANHNGGLVTFGPDGGLYLGLGDGGSACDSAGNAQNDASRLGKLLRLDVDTSPVQVETWAKGLRNPWRFAFDRATGDLYIADVGQYAWEEIDFQHAPVERGRNYGWNIFEGRHCPVSGCRTPPCTDPGFIKPVLEYDHSDGCSITGGSVYRGCRMPDLRGTYFYSDYCTPFIKTFRGVTDGQAQNLQDRTREVSHGTIKTVSSFGEDARGELYLADHIKGDIWKIVPESEVPLRSLYSEIGETSGSRLLRPGPDGLAAERSVLHRARRLGVGHAITVTRMLAVDHRQHE
jgi:glucose/arabinose dehydrogenase